MEEFKKSLKITAYTSGAALTADVLFYPLELIMTQIKVNTFETSVPKIVK